jgi:hypothetical protein
MIIKLLTVESVVKHLGVRSASSGDQYEIRWLRNKRQ